MIPKGFFPIQDTGVIQGISEAAQTVSFPEMSNRQQALAKVILKDPAVESLSSFIGIDGTNNTLNSGRIQINLKPLDKRKENATEVIRRLQPKLAEVAGITLFMQPVQDLSVEDRVSRTQFQYTLENPNVDELNTYAPRMLEKLQSTARIARRGQRPAGSGPARAAGLRPRYGFAAGDHPTSIDQTLYDAYGQRQVSTIFTQLNQYHVVLELMPGFQRNPLDLRDLYIRTGATTATTGHGLGFGRIFHHGSFARADEHAAPTRPPPSSPVPRLARAASSAAFNSASATSTAFPNGGQVPLGAFSHVDLTERADHGQSSGPVSGSDAFVQSGAQRVAGRGHERGEQGKGRSRPAGRAFRRSSRERPRPSRLRWPMSRC